ncbi:4Fe-4S binding protein, partial [Candidatus Poribacteria bacterium]|nr:4Fe-4S binding protein [Candidatus Poribacteria bacterium]
MAQPKRQGGARVKITRVRVAAQAFFLLLFLFFAFVTQFSYLKGYPVSLFLEADPLVAFATSITTHSLYRGLLWSLVLIAPTLLLGRIFCGWICPYGTLHQFIAWLASGKNTKRRMEANRYRSYFATKYYILAAMAVAAIFGSLQIGWLDPIPMLSRSLTVAV